MGKILVVEDNEDLRTLYSKALRNGGHETVLASNGQIALDLLRDFDAKPCLIILDLMMPVMDGWEFLKQRSQDPELMKVPVVVCSASRENIPTGVNVLRKPINWSELASLASQAAHCQVLN